MNNIIHHSGTISGTNFFLRYLLSVLGIFSTAIGMGIYITKENYPLIVVFSLLLSAFVYFNFITYIKRFRALFPEQVTTFAIVLIFLNILSLVIQSETIDVLFNLCVFTFNMFLIFNNSHIYELNG